MNRRTVLFKKQPKMSLQTKSKPESCHNFYSNQLHQLLAKL